jgi:hypothetical protein
MEQANGLSQSQSTSTPVAASSEPAPVTSSPAPSSEERVFRQSEVNDLIGRGKKEAVDSYIRKQQQATYSEQRYGDNTAIPQNNYQQQSLNNAVLPEDRIRQISAEAAQKHIEEVRKEAFNYAQNEQAKKTVDMFNNKMQQGKDKYNDFDSVMGSMRDQLRNFPNVVSIMSHYIENAHDVMYHLANNQGKMAEIERLADDPRFQHIAIQQAQRLSQSLKENDDASKLKHPNEPLSQMRPSNTGTGSGVMSVSDFRKKYRV